MICAFFGHRGYTFDCENQIEAEIEKLIVEADVDVFYVGNKGSFDHSVHRALKNLKYKYPDIKVFIILDTIVPIKDIYGSNEAEKEYLEYLLEDFDSLLPDGIENVPKRFAMSFRNSWMIKECDLAVVYLLFPATNTQKHVDALHTANKMVINIASLY